MITSSTKVNPLRWLWDQGKRVFQRRRGEQVDRTVAPTETVRDRHINQKIERDIAGLAADMAAGEMSTSSWVFGMRGEIKKTYINQYLLAKGGRQNMTQADWGRLGGMLKNQYGYLDKFAQDINAGKMTEAQIKARSQLYINSGRQAYERGRVAALGMPSLPAYPGDGSTQCLTNCQCHWEITEAETEWLAYWTLGAAEHCPDCVQRAQDWAPYRMPRV